MRHIGHCGERLRPRHGRVAGPLLAVLAVTSTSPALARAYHSQSLDHLIARCSTVNTTVLPAASLHRYGIKRDPGLGVVSCVVQKQRPGHEPGNIQAGVSAEYHPTGEAPVAVHMREKSDGGFLTYLGTYAVRTDGPLVFRIRVVADGEAIEMNFDDQTPRM